MNFIKLKNSRNFGCWRAIEENGGNFALMRISNGDDAEEYENDEKNEESRGTLGNRKNRRHRSFLRIFAFNWKFFFLGTKAKISRNFSFVENNEEKYSMRRRWEEMILFCLN